MHVLLGFFLPVLALAQAAVPTASGCSDGKVTYRGFYRSEVEAFVGIPYGEDTGGQNRFKPPRPKTWAPGTTFSATNEGPACPQGLGTTGIPYELGNITHISEDCLLLNVLRPNGTKAGDKLPVMVQIHGGSFFKGSKDEPVLQPEGLILQALHNGHPVMNVNINYRLGIFGFAKNDALRAEGSLNAGVLDQRLALDWVKDNIESFGGDSEQITIFGQSSGGLAVGMQILAYGGSKPVPFQRAICESQALEPGITGNFTTVGMAKVLRASRCRNTGLESAAFVSCLRSLTMDQLNQLQQKTYSDLPSANIGDVWLPTVDGSFLPKAPSQLIYEGSFANISSIIGWCQEDTDPFVPTTNNSTRKFLRNYAPSMSPANIQRILDLYPLSEFHANETANLTAEFYRSVRLLRDILMVCQPIFLGEHLTSLKGAPVYLYDQNQTILEPILASLDGFAGLGPVVHSSEIAYVFGNFSHYIGIDDLPPAQPTPEDYALLIRESRSWSTFAALGHPSLRGHNTLKGWLPAFRKSGQTDIFVIGGPDEGLSSISGPSAKEAVRVQRLQERCALLNSPEIVRQLDY